jgi:hypothetical protein
MRRCVHLLDEHGDDDVRAAYCGAALCLLCRRKKASDERRVLKLLLDEAQNTRTPPLLVFFQTLTLQDAHPAGVAASAALLVKAFMKLRRKLPRPVLGWARVVETKTSLVSPELENVHLHLVALFPCGLREKVNAIQWDELWRKCAGEVARDCDPDARVAENTGAVVRYLTKNQAWDYAEDAEIGIVDPARYVCRVKNGHSKFSYGGILKPPVYSKEDKLFGWDLAFTDDDGVQRALKPRSTIRSRMRQSKPPTYEDVEIPIENAVPGATGPRKRR